MSQFPRKPILKRQTPLQINTPQKDNFRLTLSPPNQKKISASQTDVKDKKNRKMLTFSNPQSESSGKALDEQPHLLQSPVNKLHTSQLQQIQNKHLQSQNHLQRRNSILNDRWDESFKSLLKSNENYRKELLSAYEQKVKMQAEKSKMQMEFVNLQYEKEQLALENKELQNKVTSLNKNIVSIKQNHRKSYLQLQGEVNRLKHQINLCNIDRQQLTKNYDESVTLAKDQQAKISEKQKATNDSISKNEELKGQIAFLMKRMNESQEQFFILQQKLNSSNRHIENLEFKLAKALEEVSKHVTMLSHKQKQLNELRLNHSLELQQKEGNIQQKLREIRKDQMKIRELNDQITYLRQQNFNFKGLIQSLRYIQQQNQRLRELPFALQEFKSQNQQIIRQNIALKSQKEHIHEMFINESQLLDEVSKQYEEFIKISKAKEDEQQHLFEQQVAILSIKINNLENQLSAEREKSEELSKQIAEKQNEANYATELIQKLQKLTQEKIEIIDQFASQDKKLKDTLQSKTVETKENKRVINDLAHTLKSQKEHWQYIANTNKALIDQKQKNIQSLNKQVLQEKHQKELKEVKLQQLLKKSEERQKLNAMQIQMLKQKISQLEQTERQLCKKCLNKQIDIQNREQTIKNMRLNIQSQQQAKWKLQEQIKRLQFDKYAYKEKQSQLNRALVEKQAQIEYKTAKIQDLSLQLQQLKKLRQNDYFIQQAEHTLKNYQQDYEKQKDYETKYNKLQQVIKSVYKQLSTYRNHISDIRSFNLATIQKIISTFNPTQRHNLSREIEKISQLISKITILSTKIEKATQIIKDALESRDIDRNSILVKERNMYKINKYYTN